MSNYVDNIEPLSKYLQFYLYMYLLYFPYNGNLPNSIMYNVWFKDLCCVLCQYICNIIGMLTMLMSKLCCCIRGRKTTILGFILPVIYKDQNTGKHVLAATCL